MALLDPKQIGWSIVSGMDDTRIFRRAVIGVRGQKAMVLPDSFERLEWPMENWPKSDTYNEIGLFHVLERVRDLVEFWKGLYDICANGAFVRVFGTYWNSVEVAADPTFKRGISERMFSYVSASGRKLAENDPYEDGVALTTMSEIDFEVKSLMHISEPIWEGKSDYERSYALTHYCNVARRLEVILECHKPKRVL